MSLGLSGIGTANLTGGASDNAFDLTGWTGTATIGGAAGNDTLIYGRDANFTLTNSSLAFTPVSGTARTWTLSSFENAKLSGAGNNNSFTVTGWTGGGSLTGGGGSDTVIATKNVATIALSDGSLATADGLSLALGGIGTASLTGGNTNNAFDLTGWTGAATLAAGGGTDSLTYGRDANFTLANASLAYTPASGTAQTWTISGFEAANLTGGPAQQFRCIRLDRHWLADRRRRQRHRRRDQEHRHDAHQQSVDGRHHEHVAFGHHAQHADSQQHRISRRGRLGLHGDLNLDCQRLWPDQALRRLGQRRFAGYG